MFVSYVPLLDEATKTFLAKSTTPAVTSNMGLPIAPQGRLLAQDGDTRPAMLVSTTEKDGRRYANLTVFLNIGDPSRTQPPAPTVRIAAVPYSEKKEPGTWHEAEEITLGSTQPAAKGK